MAGDPTYLNPVHDRNTPDRAPIMITETSRFGRGPLEEYRMELGFYRLGDASAGRRCEETPLVAQFRSYVADPRAAIGEVLIAGRSSEEIAG